MLGSSQLPVTPVPGMLMHIQKSRHTHTHNFLISCFLRGLPWCEVSSPHCPPPWTLPYHPRQNWPQSFKLWTKMKSFLKLFVEDVNHSNEKSNQYAMQRNYWPSETMYQSSVEFPGCWTLSNAETVRCPDTAGPWKLSSQPPRFHAQVSLNRTIPKLSPDAILSFLWMS